MYEIEFPYLKQLNFYLSIKYIKLNSAIIIMNDCESGIMIHRELYYIMALLMINDLAINYSTSTLQLYSIKMMKL